MTEISQPSNLLLPTELGANGNLYIAPCLLQAFQPCEEAVQDSYDRLADYYEVKLDDSLPDPDRLKCYRAYLAFRVSLIRLEQAIKSLAQFIDKETMDLQIARRVGGEKREIQQFLLECRTVNRLTAIRLLSDARADLEKKSAVIDSTKEYVEQVKSALLG